MIVTYYGMGMVKLQVGDTTLAVNPIGKQAEMKSPHFGADCVLVSMREAAYDGVDQMSHGEKVPFVIDGPGEYEYKGISVKGYGVAGAGEKINTIYSILLEGMHFCHLGAPASADLPAEVAESLGEIDVLFVPIYGGPPASRAGGTLDADEGEKVATLLEPKLIIPLYHAPGAAKNTLHDFLDETGEHKGEPLDKLVLKKKDLEGKEGEVVVLTPTV